MKPSASNVSAGADPNALQPLTETTKVGVGDTVTTDTSGRAEVQYDDGSVTRIAGDTTLKVVSLTEGGKRRIRLETGRVWQRVTKLTGSESNELDTPVGTAAVRGTEYDVTCDAAPSCVFTVVEGVVAVSAENGTTALLRRRQRVTSTNAGLGKVVDVAQSELDADPWIAGNVAADEQSTTTTTAVDAKTDAASLSSADPAGTYRVTTQVEQAQGVSGAKPGDTGSFTYVVTNDEDAPPRRIQVAVQGTTTIVPLTQSNNTYSGTTSVPTDCLNDDGSVRVAGGIVNSVRMTLNLTEAVGGRVSKFTGTIEITGTPTDAAQAAGCEGSNQRSTLSGRRA